MGCVSSSEYESNEQRRPQFLTGPQSPPAYASPYQGAYQPVARPPSTGRMKRAVLIGCNYPGSQYELHGCVRDIEKVYPVLQQNFGFNEIRVMLDTQSSYEDNPTGRNIKVEALLQL